MLSLAQKPATLSKLISVLHAPKQALAPDLVMYKLLKTWQLSVYTAPSPRFSMQGSQYHGQDQRLAMPHHWLPYDTNEGGGQRLIEPASAFQPTGQ